jgi:hypothetical protein
LQLHVHLCIASIVRLAMENLEGLTASATDGRLEGMSTVAPYEIGPAVAA